MKILTIIILSIIVVVIIAIIIGNHYLSIQFKTEIEKLFSLSKNISNKTFSHEQLSGLPEPVKRYFKHVLREKQPYISYVRLRHNGQFKTGLKKDWIDIKGEQYYTTERPGFVWRGKTSLFTARDMYIEDKGRLTVSLFSLFKILDGKGEEYNQGELLRWLGEGVWFPTNLLPSEYLQWSPINATSARLAFKYKELSLFYTVRFNEQGEITELETKRYMSKDKLETWVGKASDYKEINGVVIPTKIEAIWRLKTEDFSYAKFNLKNIEYNRPEKY
ncbi:MAG: DUF6544 family protein [Nitrospirota bacterium]